MRALVFLCINQHTKFEVRSFTDSKDDYGEILKTGHVTLTMPLYKGGLSSLSWDMIVHYITLQKLLNVRWLQKTVHWRITEFNI